MQRIMLGSASPSQQQIVLAMVIGSLIVAVSIALVFFLSLPWWAIAVAAFIASVVEYMLIIRPMQLTRKNRN
ncbi:hypothetical protein [Aestuariibacter salexigens]|uniref:hypothetical protein n=1 Tax=Aestuariibacter salexigens TaxID=226010 RepID=UPI0004109A10|nr:hypothetical protein [Aestuariibacter salexigens]